MKYIQTYEKLRIGNQKDLDIALLKYCKVKESLGLIRSLIAKGANVNCKNSIGSTPLLVAAQAQFCSAVKILIEKGAYVHATDNYGNNALIFLMNSHKFGDSKKECIDLLIKKNIDLAQTNHLDRDIFFNQNEAAEYIKEKYPEKYDEYLMKKDAKKYNL